MKPPINFRLSALAKEDLSVIFKYTIHNWGMAKAKEYAQQLSDGFELLSQKPKIGKSRDDLYPNALCFPINSHMVFYSINKDLDSNIEIARILHQKMNVENHF